MFLKIHYLITKLQKMLLVNLVHVKYYLVNQYYLFIFLIKNLLIFNINFSYVSNLMKNKTLKNYLKNILKIYLLFQVLFYLILVILIILILNLNLHIFNFTFNLIFNYSKLMLV